jgi:uncharacterized membrane-anchored protein YjiN (DUF445 family)
MLNLVLKPHTNTLANIKKMKNTLYVIVLLFTICSFSQSEKELIEDNCNCVKLINSNLDKEQKTKAIMDCTLNAFKKNNVYTETVVKKFTGKENIEGKDVFQYHQDVFDKIMTDNCSEYRILMSEILETGTDNEIIEKVGNEICSDLPNELSDEIIKPIIDRITNKNYQEISKNYSAEEGKQYILDLRKYLVFNCGKYRKYAENLNN